MYVLSLPDFLGAATKIAQRDNRLVEMYVLVAVVFFVLSFTASRGCAPARAPGRLRTGVSRRSGLSMIEIERLGKCYGDLPVLRDCSLAVARGEVVVVCGPSGSGKSTLIKCVNRLEPFESGRIVVDGTDVGALAPTCQRCVRVGMVFQHFDLFPHLSVLENVCLGQMSVLGRSRAPGAGQGGCAARARGVAAHRDKHPGQLSGGQQQRVAIARALAMDPVVMLFDEPTSALDPEMIGEVLDVMTGLARDGMTMMVVTHEMGFARRVADRIVFMEAGEIIDDVASAEFFGSAASPRSREFLSRIISH